MLLDTGNDAPSPDQTTNTFVAIRPPQSVAKRFYSRATRLCSRARIVGRQRPSSILHMTLLPIAGSRGRLPRVLLEKIDAAISMVRFPAFEIALDEARSFETRKDNVPFVLEGGALTDLSVLRLFTGNALDAKGLNIPVRTAYAPHMTLAYARLLRALEESFEESG